MAHQEGYKDWEEQGILAEPKSNMTAQPETLHVNT